jgi:hypothetical protein
MDGEKKREQHGNSDKVGTGRPAGLARERGGRDSGAGGTARTLDSEQVRALLGAIFFTLSLLYVVKTIAAATRETRQR